MTKKINYQDYLSTLNKNELISILNTFDIDFNKNEKKANLVDLIMNSLNVIVDSTLEMFQQDELSYLNLIVKKKGKVNTRVNYLLLSFLNNLKRHHLVIEQTKVYYMPQELLRIYSKKIKNKSVIQKIKDNTLEYNLILGIIDAYGVIPFNEFYDLYAKDYKLTKDIALKRISNLSTFFYEFKIIKKKNDNYLANLLVDKADKFNTSKIKRAIYTNEEFRSIHDFSIFKNNKNYKKLKKFVNQYYYVEKKNYKIIINFILIPYLANNQLDENIANNILSSLIDHYFEFNNDKTKEKMTNLFKNIASDYPSWKLLGHTQKENIC